MEVNGIKYNVKICEEGEKSENKLSSGLEEASMVEESQLEKIPVQVGNCEEEEEDEHVSSSLETKGIEMGESAEKGVPLQSCINEIGGVLTPNLKLGTT